MSGDLKPGARLRSAVCTTEVVVIRVGDAAASIECGGVPMVAAAAGVAAEEGAAPKAGFDSGSLIGKRYGDTGDAAELLCTKAGAGSLSVGGVLLAERHAKALPASD